MLRARTMIFIAKIYIEILTFFRIYAFFPVFHILRRFIYSCPCVLIFSFKCRRKIKTKDYKTSVFVLEHNGLTFSDIKKITYKQVHHQSKTCILAIKYTKSPFQIECVVNLITKLFKW